MPQKNNIQLIMTRQKTSKRPSRLFPGSQASKRPPKAPKSLQKHPKASKSLQKGLQKAFKRKKKAFTRTNSISMYVCVYVCSRLFTGTKSLKKPPTAFQKPPKRSSTDIQKTFKRHSKGCYNRPPNGLQKASQKTSTHINRTKGL